MKAGEAVGILASSPAGSPEHKAIPVAHLLNHASTGGRLGQRAKAALKSKGFCPECGKKPCECDDQGGGGGDGKGEGGEE